jgi:hypothetical protein
MSGLVLQITPQPHTVMFAILLFAYHIIRRCVSWAADGVEKQPESAQMRSVCSRILHWNALEVF